ncbi:thiamine phosphate synthase [Oceanobacillus alkalisoli]|uniref:thiamine phosphate synthase n=1 Tax=Oceanobacillus alkalisoli TaxID=2925113 RepID=UPI001F121207|nr:thiamine phosphate synthase [Oceanobacillus alkalisoli]MCF3944275.1 thiamine phosphate synthase [Oceanobacillus alkalisoli]
MKLIAVTDDRYSIKELAEMIIAIKDEVDYVQIREKSKTARSIMTLLDSLESGGMDKAKISINDRLDIALLKGITNLHLPEHGLAVKMVKKLYPHLRVGCSVHSVAKAKEMEREGADYVIYGHCFETDSKKGIPPNGLENLIRIKKELEIPVYGIGGITLEKTAVMKETRADGIAVMSSIFQAAHPRFVLKEFREAISC